ncbi:MAG: hypothetical protein KF684_04970 [Phycisphaeraceae bacterium]|nr:hypothetical protein [Phycisphaeraceae bacterium]
MRYLTRSCLLAFPLLGALAGCVDPGANRPVLENQGAIIARLETSYAHDLAAVRSLASSLLDAQRERLVASIELDLVANTLDASGNAPDDARPWLADFAALLRTGAPTELRRAALASHTSLRAFDDAAAALLDALDARAAGIAALFTELRANHAALADAAGASVDLSLASREAATLVWRETVLAGIDDPDARAAAQRLLDRVLNPTR